MASSDTEYSGLLEKYSSWRGMPLVLDHIAVKLDDISAMTLVANKSIKASLPDEPEQRVLMVASNAAFQLQQEILILKEALLAKTAGGEA